MEDEGAARRRYVEPLSDGEPCVEVAAGDAVAFALDRDPVVAGIGRAAERVVPQHRSLRVAGLDPQRQVLPGSGGRQCGTGGIFESDRDHGVALARDRRRRQPAEAGPGGRRTRGDQAGVPATGLAVDEGAEGGLPAGAECGNAQCPEQLLPWVTGQVEERVELGDRHLFRPGGELDDFVARLHLALFEDAEVEAGAMMGDEERRNALVVHADPDSVAGDPRLGDFENGSADPVAVADADLVVAQSLDGEVLTELSVDEVVSAELALPVAVRLDLVDEDGTLLAAVSGQVTLSVPVDVELPYAPGAVDGVLEHAREHRLSLPRHVLRQADVDGQQGADLGWLDLL